MILRVGVPSGVGDVYWVLTKLKAIREHYGADGVRLYVRKSEYDRALAWPQMVDFVDEAVLHEFRPCVDALGCGIGRAVGVDVVLWPNAIIDGGGTLADWMPTLVLDQAFPIKTVDMGPSRAIVYVSSEAVDKRWMGRRGRKFWERLIQKLGEEFGPITLVGAAWDESMRRHLRSEVEDLVGATTLPQLAGLLKNARVVVGIISGVTILANHFRVPTVAFWPDKHFPKSFPRAWVPANAPYLPIPASTTSTPKEIARLAASVVGSAAIG